MEQPVRTGVPARTAPSFYITGRQPVRLGSVLLATAVVAGAVLSVPIALRHAAVARATASSGDPASSSGAQADDDKDDPNQVDTIVLGDPGEAPVPARRGKHVSSVHPTMIIRLPSVGNQVGLIPDSPAGHFLYDWMAAFNQANLPALESTLPSVAAGPAAAAQMQLRLQTGGYRLVSAKEIQPGILVFRLRDQTPAATEVLGTLQVRPDSSPATIASFSLREVP